jgi:hypothetical protein
LTPALALSTNTRSSSAEFTLPVVGGAKEREGGVNRQRVKLYPPHPHKHTLASPNPPTLVRAHARCAVRLPCGSNVPPCDPDSVCRLQRPIVSTKPFVRVPFNLGEQGGSSSHHIVGHRPIATVIEVDVPFGWLVGGGGGGWVREGRRGNEKGGEGTRSHHTNKQRKRDGYPSARPKRLYSPFPQVAHSMVALQGSANAKQTPNIAVKATTKSFGEKVLLKSVDCRSWPIGAK